ncbi:MAG: class I SAM-dependent methyltransferase [Cytophagales bacterium]|nr:MAG: class I SAM-dependent methyltransferase [Cytophagales bacterium]
MSTNIKVNITDVKKYWNENPVAAAAVPYEPGTKEFFDYYDKLREANESLNFSYNLHEFKNFKGKKVLDVGCGNGYVLSKFAKEGAEVYGVDITDKAIELTTKRFDLLDLKGNFQVANAEQLPFEDETFDCVTSMGVLHHVPDTIKAVSEVHRVLKKDGRLIVMFYHKNSIKYLFRFQLLKLLGKKNIQTSVNEVDGVGNPKGDVYTKKELKLLLKDFKNIEMFAGLVEPYHFLPGKLTKIFPRALLKPFERSLGWFLYAKAYKK